jgi:SSS family solute:Na+ symporter
MSWIDWSITAGFFTCLLGFILYIKRFNRSVADFLAANRTAGRYMLTVSMSSASFGTISIVALFEMHFQTGFSPLFWSMLLIPIGFIISASGWVIYRYRETRVLTLAQFFELRYDKSFRVFMGVMAFASGMINYGVFPAVTAHFFLYFCDLPPEIHVLSLTVSTFPLIMLLELGVALTITLGGGQIAIMIADFLQGQFINIVMLVVIVSLVALLNWKDVSATLLSGPSGASYVNPFNTSQVHDFNVWYYLIALVGAFYCTMAWQGSQAFNACAKNPHESRMGAILGQWRFALTTFLPPLAAIAALTLLRHPSIPGLADAVHRQLALIPNAEVQRQMTVPLVLRLVFPVGVMGLFTASMISSSLSIDSSYLHSWGSIFIQDVVLPLYGRPLSPQAHMRALKLSVLSVAIFAFCFSLLFQQTENILLFFAVTGAIFVGGAGSVIIGGLYWKKGTTPAAWAAMAIGSTIALTGVFIRQLVPAFPFNGQEMLFFAMVSASSVYVAISLFQNREFDLDRLLYRGKYHELLPAAERGQKASAQGWLALAPGPNFTLGDRWIYWMTLGMQMSFFLSTAMIMALYFLFRFSDQVWLKIWFGYGISFMTIACGTIIWFVIGGAHDFRETLRLLRTGQRNQLDDGTVSEGEPEEAAGRPPLTVSLPSAEIASTL